MRVRTPFLAVLAVILTVTPTGAQEEAPRVGAGAFAGTILGVELMDHTFPLRTGGESVPLIQQVGLTKVIVRGVQGEWFVHPHVALRGQASWGSGDVYAETWAANGASIDAARAARFRRGFGDVSVRALDGGVSIWPWSPRTVGFAPFVTVGYGRVTYDFSTPVDDDRFFLADGDRTGESWVVGGGADMRIWESVTLRMEATNHIVEPPLDASDFARFGERRAMVDGGVGDRVSNVRLVIGAHVYLPFDDGDGI